MSAAPIDRTPPAVLSLNIAGLPLDDLAPYPHCVTWDLEWRDGKNGKSGGWTKILKNPRTGTNARSNDPDTWGTAGEVLARFDRFGYVVAETDPFTFLDVDNGIDPETGEPKPWAQAIVDHFPGAYWERSTTGTGLKGLIRARSPEMRDGRTRNRVIPAGDGKIEIFFWGKFTALTGDRLAGCAATIGDGQAALEVLITELCPEPAPRPSAPLPVLNLDDREIIERVRRMTKGRQLFDAGDISLYGGDHSDADLALLNCFVSAGATNSDQLDRLYQESALHANQPNWDSKNYRERTIARALDGTVQPFEGWDRPALTPRSHTVPPMEPPSLGGSDTTGEHDLRSENARLRAALDACCADRAELRRQNAELRAERDQAKRDLSAVMKTLDNPNLGGDAAGKALILAAAEVQHRSHTVPPNDGYVQVNASRIADRTIYVDGEPVPVPARISPRTVTKYVGLAADAGLIDAKKDEIPAPVGKPAIKNEGWYWRAAPTLADQLAPLAGGSVYSDDNPRPLRGGDPAKRRRLRTLPGCPDCGGHHVACATCGTLYDTPAAVDLETGETLSAAEMPPDDAVLPPAVVDGTNVDKFADDARAHTVPPEKRERRNRAAADLATREPPWLMDAPDPRDTPPQPALFPHDDLPPGQSFHFSAD